MSPNLLGRTTVWVPPVLPFDMSMSSQPPEPPDPTPYATCCLATVTHGGQCNTGANILVTPDQSCLHEYVLLQHPFALAGIAAGTTIQCIAHGKYYIPTDTLQKFPIPMYHCPKAGETVISPQHACHNSTIFDSFEQQGSNSGDNSIIFCCRDRSIALTLPLLKSNNLFYLFVPSSHRVS